MRDYKKVHTKRLPSKKEKRIERETPMFSHHLEVAIPLPGNTFSQSASRSIRWLRVRSLSLCRLGSRCLIYHLHTSQTVIFQRWTSTFLTKTKEKHVVETCSRTKLTPVLKTTTALPEKRQISPLHCQSFPRLYVEASWLAFFLIVATLLMWRLQEKMSHCRVSA